MQRLFLFDNAVVFTLYRMKILHLAIENFAGIPMRLVREERRRGHHSRLVTLLTPHQNFEEDIALRLPFLNLQVMPSLRRVIRGKKYQYKTNRRHNETSEPKQWQPSNILEKALLKMRDALWKPYIASALKITGNLDEYDIIIADGGHDFTRFPDKLLSTQTPLVIFYYGSDLRTRGIIPEIQHKAKATFTFEYDHTLLFPATEFLFYPYEPPEYSPSITYGAPMEGEKIKIGHAPTNRIAKGTDAILAALHELQAEYPIEIVLIENMSHDNALQLKSTCHLFIDQIGELGYGLNAVESLHMGIPTCVELLPDFEKFLQDKCGGTLPFYNIRRATLYEDIRAVLQHRSTWQHQSQQSIAWVSTYHSVGAVADRYMARIEDIIH